MKAMKLWAMAAGLGALLPVFAKNPVIQTSFTPDPAPFVFNDTVFLFVDHDEDDAYYFTMRDWQLYSSTDMVNWTYRGTPISTETFKWALQGNNAWASQAIERDGKWYWYVAAEDTVAHLHGVGVAMADSPDGPWIDPLGKPLVPGNWGYIDPSVFIDDDGQAYLFWGNNGAWYAPLNADMISLAGEIKPVPGLDDEKAFGPLRLKTDYATNSKKMKTNYEEGPWVLKRNGIYYLVYAAGGVPEHMAYSTAESIHGPWKFGGQIMGEAPGSFTIHGGNIEYKGKNYMFYHNGMNPNGQGFRRATCVEEFKFNDDGSIPFIPFTEEGVVEPVGSINPYARVEAETMAESYGLKTDRNPGTEHVVTSVNNGDWIKVRTVDFGDKSPRQIIAAVKDVYNPGAIEFFADRIDGKPFARIEVGESDSNKTLSAPVTTKAPEGMHDVYVLFRSNSDKELFDMDWWQLSENAYVDYRNPIIYADVPDVSVCRVGDDFYMVSTTMHLMPGAPIMHSTDLRHWETVSYVFPEIKDGPRYDLIDGSAYGQGQWASTIRHHNGKFYVWFTANGAPGKGFIFSADKAEGPWTLVSRPPHYHDGSLFFDDDGRVYIFHTTGRLTELAPDLSGPLAGGVDMQIFERDADEQGLLEGSQVIKRDGKYYLMMISWNIAQGKPRREVCYRADSITGPYEKKVILETRFENGQGVAQGGIIDDKDGNWYGIMFQDRFGIGRTPCLMPCTWTADGWPMLGDENGNLPSNTSLPYEPLDGICGSDDFSSPDLSLYWQFNHNPVNTAWSLTERPGFLRLTTPRLSDNVYVAPNTITQRMTGPACEGIAKIDFSGMKPGDRAGLAAFNSDSGLLYIDKEGKKCYLVMSLSRSVFNKANRSVSGTEDTEYARIPLDRTEIWLKVMGDFTNGKDMATFAYSLDGTKWISIGEPVKLGFDTNRMFMGTKFAIFNYATKKAGGYIDVDSFEFRPIM